MTSTEPASALSGFYELKVNKNRVNVLSKERRKGRLHLSLHEKFLEAPEEVIQSLINWASDREKPRDRKVLRDYINAHFARQPRRMPALNARGKVYDLQAILEELNATYFDNKVDIPITWYTSHARRRPWLGQYLSDLKLIRINKRLDSRRYPKTYVEYVVYHEMLHHVLPAVNGRHHHKEFVRRERQFAHWAFVQKYENRVD